jgi:tetratricopeptide (TPR) repeat protein
LIAGAVVESPVAGDRDLAVLRSFTRRIDPSDAGAHNNLGVLFFHKELFPEAVASFARALELDPKMAVAQRNLEIAYRQSGFYDRRITELRERLRRHPEDRDARWELARACGAVGQTAEAREEYAAMLAQDARDLGALTQLGLLEQRLGNLEAALSWFERALQIDPGSSVIEYHRGEVLYNRGANDGALAALQRAVELNPDNAEAYHLLAFVLGDLQRHGEARAAAKRAARLNPSLTRAQANLALEAREAKPLPEAAAPQAVPADGSGDRSKLAHFHLATAFRRRGFFVEALREYRLALERGEDHTAVRRAMAEVQLLRGDHAAALELYDQLVEEEPASAKAWNERGIALHQSGHRDEALASYRRALVVEPGHAPAANNVGVVLASLGQAEAAIEAFRDALQLRGDLLPARLNLALLLAHSRRHQLALEAYRHTLEVAPESAMAWNGVGLVLVELQRFEDARNAFARAVEAGPDAAAAHYNLSFTLSHLGEFEGALREVKRALELDPYYVPQKYLLALDLPDAEPALEVAPEQAVQRPFEGGEEEFVFDPRLLDSLFAELKPPGPLVAAERARDADDPFTLARDYVSKGLFEHAAAEITRAVGRGADRAEGAVLAGEVFVRRRLFGEALERYREALQLSPDHARARAGEMRCLLALGLVAEAAPLAERLRAAAPDDVDAALLVAEARSRSGDPAGALDVLRQAQARSPERADVRKLLGDVARAVGDGDVARDAYRGALDLDPAYVEVWVEYGRLCERRGDAPEAEQAYRQALARLPSYAVAALALARLLHEEGRGAEAMEVLIGVLARDPYDQEALVLLTRVLLDRGMEGDARAAAERAVRFQPDHAAARYHLGLALARERRYREAVAQWDQVIALEPASPLAAQARSHARTARDLVHIFAGETS